MAEFKNFDSSVLEGHVKFREKKAWKRRWCVVRRLSPVANSLTMQFYKKSSNKSKGAVSKASLNLEHLLGLESCFLLQKESQTLAIICRTLVAVLAFENREMLLEWQAQITEILGHSEKYEVQLLSVPGKLEITSGSAVLHIRDWQFSLTQGTPPRLIGYWNMADLRRFGAVDDRRFCFEGGSRCSSRGFEGVFVLGSSRSQEISSKFEFAVRGRLCEFQRARIHPSSTLNGLLTPMTRHRVNSRCNVGNAQSMSKPNTPLLGSQRRAQEFCLSPPCARHTRSYSQQHSRTSSISSGTRLSSALQRSDPELLYDKPRSLNAAQAVYEVCGGGGGGGTVEARPPADATLPANHYDTPRRILQNLSVQNGQSNGNVLQVPNGISSLYATVTKTKKSKKTAADPAQEVQGYLVVERGGGGGAGGVGGVTGMGSSQQQTDYVQMQSLPCSPATLLQRQARCLATMDQCRRSCCGDRVYQNSNVAYRCLYNKSCYAHCTLPLLHPKSTHQTESQSAASGMDVPLRLRRSASMPASACRQVGNRDSSDSTDSGVSVTADASAHYASMMNGAGHHHHRTRNGGCVHHQLYLPRHWSLPRPHANHQSVALWSDASSASSSGVNHLTAAAAAQSTVNQSAHSQSNSSSLSNILDRLETLSVASVGYETCV